MPSTLNTETVREKIERMRAVGIEPSPQILEAERQEAGRAAHLAAIQAEAEARQAERKRQRFEARITQAVAAAERGIEQEKTAARAAWAEAGGLAADFEPAWPALHSEIIRKRTVDRLTGGAAGGAPVRVEL